MDIKDIIDSLDKNKDTLRNLLTAFPEDFIKWKPSPDKWCLLEIVNHLYDEEREDFRARTKKILDEDVNWDPIRPQEWVSERKYIERDFNESLNNFIKEREYSIKWLNDSINRSWNAMVSREGLGSFTAREMLSSWLAHDMLHIRQILKLQYLYLEDSIKPSSLEYAGGW
jgi:hypothetical protein